MIDFFCGIVYMKFSELILVCRNKMKIVYNMLFKLLNWIEKYSVSGIKIKFGVVMKILFGYFFWVCVNVNNDCVVFDIDGYLWFGSLKNIIKIFKLSN